MKQSAKFARRGPSPRSGFSLVELVLSLAVLLVLTTLAVPVVLRSLQAYQLNSTASQLAGMLKFTKFGAIRQNTHVSCQVAQQGANWLVWVDLNGNTVADATEPQMIISGSATLLPANSVPSTASIALTLGAASSYGWTVISVPNGSVMYDQRGVVVTYSGANIVTATTIYALYLGNPNDPNSGYRAIITLPSGAVQVWTSSLSGNWQRVS